MGTPTQDDGHIPASDAATSGEHLASKATLVQMGTDEAIDVSALERDDDDAVEPDGEGGDVLSTIKTFGVESGHVQRVDKALTESIATNIARNVVSGTSEAERNHALGDGDRLYGPDDPAPTSYEGPSERTPVGLWVALAALVVLLAAVIVVLALYLA